MSEFFVGQKVVCVDDRIGHDVRGELVKGELYTISELLLAHDFTLDLENQTMARVAERPAHFYYGLWRLRPLDSKAISIFRQIAKDVTEGRKVTVRA